MTELIPIAILAVAFAVAIAGGIVHELAWRKAQRHCDKMNAEGAEAWRREIELAKAEGRLPDPRANCIRWEVKC